MIDSDPVTAPELIFQSDAAHPKPPVFSGLLLHHCRIERHLVYHCRLPDSQGKDSCEWIFFGRKRYAELPKTPTLSKRNTAASHVRGPNIDQGVVWNRCLLTANLVHGSVRTDKLLIVGAVAGAFGPRCHIKLLGDRFVVTPISEKRSNVPFLGREEAVSDLTLRRETKSVALAAKGFGDRIDQANSDGRSGDMEIAGRLTWSISRGWS